MEELLDIASQPVAFATAPLETMTSKSSSGLGSSNSDTDADDGASQRLKRWLTPKRTGSFPSALHEKASSGGKMSYPPDPQATIIDLRELDDYVDEDDGMLTMVHSCWR
jgi:hypothetical protein